MTGRNNVFLSYSVLDKALVPETIEKLEALGLIRGEDETFVDESAIADAASWRDALKSSIDAASTVVVLWSKAASQSANVNYEAGMADALGKRIIVVLPEDEEVPIPSELENVEIVKLKDVSLEQIRTKIAELETKIADLRTTERELLALRAAPASRAKVALEPSLRSKPSWAWSTATGPRKTIGLAIAEILGSHGPLKVAEIADRIQSTGRDINRRTVAYSLQAMKKRGLVSAADGRWGLAKGWAASTRA